MVVSIYRHQKQGFIETFSQKKLVIVLTIKRASSATVNQTICPSQLPYTWNGFIFTKSSTRTIFLSIQLVVIVLLHSI